MTFFPVNFRMVEWLFRISSPTFS